MRLALLNELPGLESAAPSLACDDPFDVPFLSRATNAASPLLEPGGCIDVRFCDVAVLAPRLVGLDGGNPGSPVGPVTEGMFENLFSAAAGSSPPKSLVASVPDEMGRPSREDVCGYGSLSRKVGKAEVPSGLLEAMTIALLTGSQRFAIRGAVSATEGRCLCLRGCRTGKMHNPRCSSAIGMRFSWISSIVQSIRRADYYCYNGVYPCIIS